MKLFYAINIALSLSFATVLNSGAVHAQSPEEIEHIILDALPDASVTQVTAFADGFMSLRPFEQERELPMMQSFSSDEIAMMLGIFASAYDSPEVQQQYGPQTGTQILVKYAISIPDIIENLEYVIEHDGDARDGDAVEVGFHINNLVEKFPTTAQFFDDGRMGNIIAVYEQASHFSAERLERARAKLERARAKLERERAKLERARAEIQRLEQELKSLRELRLKMETLRNVSQ